MNDIYYYTIPISIGFILDSILGDPKWLPHPIRFFGSTISFADAILNKGSYKKIKGVIVTVVFVMAVWLTLCILQILVNPYKYLHYAIMSVLLFFAIANRNLIDEVLNVNRKLVKEGIESGRKQLSYIVGRETTNLTENQVRVASLETLSENLSDGVIAPLFYYLIGGIPLMFAYKMINTLDSMIGYKSSRYKEFGWFAARLDDAVNFIPARITALIMVIITFSRRGFFFTIKYGHKHSSPNSGYPEAALAGILNCRFGGPNIYHGELVEKPFIGENNRTICSKDIYRACWVNFFACLFFILVYLFIINREKI